MAVSEALKIARLQARTQREHDLVELVKLFAPVIELIGGVTVIEYQARHGNIGQVAVPFTLAALYGIVGVQVLAPVIPTITASNTAAIDSVTKALPALASSAAALALLG